MRSHGHAHDRDGNARLRCARCICRLGFGGAAGQGRNHRYCMTGQHAVNFAARNSRIAAAASFHGVQLVTDQATSPHLKMQTSNAAFYFGCAELDQWAPLDQTAVLSETAQTTKANAEVEIYKGADHGFVFPARHAYDKAAAEQHWQRLLALFRQNVAKRLLQPASPLRRQNRPRRAPRLRHRLRP
ncbi:MAG: dienelactone hydrolase family protein [Caulobacterales bacterium]